MTLDLGEEGRRQEKEGEEAVQCGPREKGGTAAATPTDTSIATTQSASKIPVLAVMQVKNQYFNIYTCHTFVCLCPAAASAVRSVLAN